jgi:hypothetical protein
VVFLHRRRPAPPIAPTLAQVNPDELTPKAALELLYRRRAMLAG